MKSLFEEMGGTYSQQGDYLLPDVKLPPQDERPIGILGQRRREFLKSRHRVKYYNMLTKCTLYTHLADISEEAEAMEDRLSQQFKAQDGITEAPHGLGECHEQHCRRSQGDHLHRTH